MFLSTGRKTVNDESEDLRRVGRDEMNLAEFPIALLTDYPPRAGPLVPVCSVPAFGG